MSHFFTTLAAEVAVTVAVATKHAYTPIIFISNPSVSLHLP